MTAAPATARAKTGADWLLDVLVDEGVTRVFGNPGTTELPLVAAIGRRDDVRYVLALHEGTAVAMADGYALTSGRPAFLNLHTTSGLGNAMGQLVNAAANHSPLIVTAGQQDRRHLVRDPMLSGDLVGMVRPVVKWAHEVTSLADLPVMVRRAVHDATAAPAGPVFLSLPLDLLEEAGQPPDPGRSILDGRNVSGGLEELADLLAEASPDELALVLDDEVVASGAVAVAVEVAEALGADVYGAPFHGRAVFPPLHPLWRGDLGGSSAAIAKALANHRRVLYIGGQAFLTLHYAPDDTVPTGVELLHLSPSPHGPGRVHRTRLGLVGDPAATLQTLLPRLRPRLDAPRAAARLETAATQRRAAYERFEGLAAERSRTSPLHPMGAVHALLRALPPDAQVVDEAVTTSVYVRGLHHAEGDRYLSCRGGGLGWGMPAAVGASLASGAPVLCIVGDGAAMYAPHALWTAARERLPVVFAVVNNRQYLILKRFMASSADFDADAVRPMLDLDDPPVDYVGLARSLGVRAATATTAAEVDREARLAWRGPGPTLIEISIVTVD